MTDKSLNNLINVLNKGQRKEHVFIRQLSDSVDLIKVFMDNPKMTDKKRFQDLIPDTFYCIKNDKQYVGIVYDMSSDLHWYMKKEYRGNGYLTKALKEIILPFILRDKDEQRITISRYEIGDENFKASEKVAISSGFKLQDEFNEKYEYIIKDNDCDILDTDGINKTLREEELKEISQKVFYYAKKLIRLQTKLEVCYGSDDELIYEFKEQINKLWVMGRRSEGI